jgi:hypothetical protein
MRKPRISLFAEQEREDRRAKLGDPLVGLAEHVDFEALTVHIDAAPPRPSRAKGGRSPYPTVLISRFVIATPRARVEHLFGAWRRGRQTVALSRDRTHDVRPAAKSCQLQPQASRLFEATRGCSLLNQQFGSLRLPNWFCRISER